MFGKHKCFLRYLLRQESHMISAGSYAMLVAVDLPPGYRLVYRHEIAPCVPPRTALSFSNMLYSSSIINPIESIAHGTDHG